MGCGATSGRIHGAGAPAGENDPSPVLPSAWDAQKDPRAIIVWGAKELRSADSLGHSDAYCIVRVGSKGLSWAEKGRSIGRRSATACGSSCPVWNMGFAVDVSGMVDPEIQIRVYDDDWASADDFLGEAVCPMGTSRSSSAAEVTLNHGSGSISVSSGHVDMLKTENIKPSAYFEEMLSKGLPKKVGVNEISGTGPLIPGTAPLPEVVQGIFWLMGQGSGSALCTFGGPNRDGGGCSTGQLATGRRYRVRVCGDRVWAFADLDSPSARLSLALDLVYNFVMDDAANPTRMQIYPESRTLNIPLTAEWIMDFEAHLLDGSPEGFPGSVAWSRPSWILGQEIKSAEYMLLQVVDGKGERIEPAWRAFVEYQGSPEAGPHPGELFYHEAADA